MRLIPTLGYGTYLFGQIQNIKCANSTYATLNSSEASVPNSCRIGVTINNLMSNSTQRAVFRAPMFNISTINLPNIANLLNSSHLGIAEPGYLFVNSTVSPETSTVPMTGNCENVGGVFNPLGNQTNGVIGQNL